MAIYTGIQYTTEWTLVKTTNGEQTKETCRLVKSLNGNMTVFYTNTEVANLTTAEYQTAFDNTLAYMSSMGWDKLPLFDESCKTNIDACPIIPPSKYAVVPISFVCQDSGLAILPPRLTGWKFASIFQYRINGVPSGTTRLVKTFNVSGYNPVTGNGVTFYTDAEISMLSASDDIVDVIHPIPYKQALNLTEQYITFIGWIATPDINACRLADTVSCPTGRRGILIDATNFGIDVDSQVIEYLGAISVGVSLNGISDKMGFTEEVLSGNITLADIEVNMDALNVMEIVVNNVNAGVTTSLDADAESIDTEYTDSGVKKTLKLTGDTINEYIIVNNRVKSLNVSVNITALL
jgi:hypothetical protein